MYTTAQTVKTCPIGEVLKITTVDIFGYGISQYKINLNKDYTMYKTCRAIWNGYLPNYSTFKNLDGIMNGREWKVN